MTQPFQPLRRFIAALKRRRAYREVARCLVAAFVGRDFYDRLRNRTLLRALGVHDANDEELPCREGRPVAEKLDAAPVRTTEGVGHRKILTDPFLWEEAIPFTTLAPPVHHRQGGSQ